MGSSSIAALFPQRVVIGVGDYSVSNNPALTLSTYALGSCLAVVAFDALRRNGGLLHLMLPDSGLSPEKARTQPAMFVDTGLPLLLRSMVGLQSDARRLKLFVTGGASVLTGHDTFRIGERNASATRDYLTRLDLRPDHWIVGGTVNRTVHLELATGLLTLKTALATESFSLA